MLSQRTAGVLLPIASLPSPYGIGDFGPSAQRFVNFLHASGQRMWNILPLLITDELGSPYAPMSAFAMNWMLVSPEQLVADGLLMENQLQRITQPNSAITYPSVNEQKRHILGLSWTHFQQHATQTQQRSFGEFRDATADWLDDYTLYMAIKDRHSGAPWHAWPEELRNRDPQTLESWRRDHELEMEYFAYGQWIVHEQWRVIQRLARERSLSILGDLPFFLPHDSVDVWAHRELFALDADGRPEYVAGAPPDNIRREGQRWGHPLYRWDAHLDSQFGWWLQRIGASLSWYDLLRLDHFRGFRAAWAVPANTQDASKGTWQPAPGERFFRQVQATFREAHLFAENLGYITDDVEQLREQFHIPGMYVLQFAWSGNPREKHLPDNIPEQGVVYTGTHDLPPLRGWCERGHEADAQRALDALHTTPDGFAAAAINAGMQSKGALFITQLQDVLGLGNETRINTPGTTNGNWQWRVDEALLTKKASEWLRTVTTEARR